MKLCEILTSEDVAGILFTFLKKSLIGDWKISHTPGAYLSAKYFVHAEKEIRGEPLEFAIEAQKRGTVFEIQTSYLDGESTTYEETVHEVLMHIAAVSADPKAWALNNPRNDSYF